MNARTIKTAKNEMRRAIKRYDDESFGLGQEFYLLLIESFREIRSNPQQFPIVDYVRKRREYRQCILKKFPYSVIYHVRPHEIVIIAIAHHRRRPAYWARRSLDE